MNAPEESGVGGSAEGVDMTETSTKIYPSADPAEVRALLAADPRFEREDSSKPNDFYIVTAPFGGERYGLADGARAWLSVDDEREQVFIIVSVRADDDLRSTFVALRYGAFDTAGQLVAAVHPVSAALAEVLQGVSA